MITHYPFKELGSTNYGWLKATYHFSFANYYNPARMGFGKIRVINDDWIAAQSGFPAHSHRNMEIISFIKSGAISHQDSSGNQGVVNAGEVQVMSAGSGIEHSEYNHSKDPLTLYQIWIETNKQNVTPRWESKKFITEFASELTLLVSGYEEDKDQALFIYQNAKIYGGKIKAGTTITHNIQHQAYLLAADGQFNIEENAQHFTINKGDGVEISNTEQVKITAITDTEIILIDSV